MMHITYMRRSDKCRIVFAMPGLTELEAREYAAAQAPWDFEPVATCHATDGRMHVPVDGGDYGQEPSEDQIREWRDEFAAMMVRNGAAS